MYKNALTTIRRKLILDTVNKGLCEPYVKSDFQKDSIFSKLYLAKFYLDRRNFSITDSLINNFENSYDYFVFDSTLLFESGLYSDLKMRSLFVQNKYNEICHYVRNDLEYNLVVKINDEDEFKIYTAFVQ